jgi:hypothetical protein
MPKFNIGDRVEIISSIQGSIARSCIGQVARITGIGQGGAGFFPYSVNTNQYYWPDQYLKKVENNMENLQVGDVVTKDNNWREESFTVVNVLCGAGYKIYLGIDEDGGATLFSPSELEAEGFDLPEEEDEAVEMTVAEIEEELGHPVKVVKDEE